MSKNDSIKLEGIGELILEDAPALTLTDLILEEHRAMWRRVAKRFDAGEVDTDGWSEDRYAIASMNLFYAESDLKQWLITYIEGEPEPADA